MSRGGNRGGRGCRAGRGGGAARPTTRSPPPHACATARLNWTLASGSAAARMATAPAASDPGPRSVGIAECIDVLGKLAENIAASSALRSGGILRHIQRGTLPDPPDAAHNPITPGDHPGVVLQARRAAAILKGGRG